jgi:hypothetical protein
MEEKTYKMTVLHETSGSWTVLISTASVERTCREIVDNGFIHERDGVTIFIPPRFIKMVTFTEE